MRPQPLVSNTGLLLPPAGVTVIPSRYPSISSLDLCTQIQYSELAWRHPKVPRGSSLGLRVPTLFLNLLHFPYLRTDKMLPNGPKHLCQPEIAGFLSGTDSQDRTLSLLPLQLTKSMRPGYFLISPTLTLSPALWPPHLHPPSPIHLTR